jgi:uncharacterized membrane protein YeaQ/YmgE (transglycosylase-associated protein family)
MGIIAWVILGLLAGAIAKAIYPGRQGGGLVSTMLLGVVGAFLDGALHSFLYNGSLQLVGTSLKNLCKPLGKEKEPPISWR